MDAIKGWKLALPGIIAPASGRKSCHAQDQHLVYIAAMGYVLEEMPPSAVPLVYTCPLPPLKSSLCDSLGVF
jgi:hypothetical protein